MKPANRLRTALTRLTALVALLGLAWVALPATPGLSKEFDLVGIVDCGVRSDQRCPADAEIIGIRVDAGGDFQRFKVDFSWIRDLPRLRQDDLVCVEVSDAGRNDGVLQALRLTVNCDESGSFNPGINRAEQPRRPDEDDDPLPTPTVTPTGTVLPTANLRASIEDTNDPALEGEHFSFIATIRNTGPNELAEFTARFRLIRDAVTPVDFTGSNFTTFPSPPTFECVITSTTFTEQTWDCVGFGIPPGEEATITFEGFVEDPGPFTATILADSANAITESDEGDNFDSESTLFLPDAP